jgi:hypothetical protein
MHAEQLRDWVCQGGSSSSSYSAPDDHQGSRHADGVFGAGAQGCTFLCVADDGCCLLAAHRWQLQRRESNACSYIEVAGYILQRLQQSS